MNNRDREEDRAAYLFEQIKPELIKLLRNAPEYGSCGVNVNLVQGEVVRISVTAEVTRRLNPKIRGSE